MKLRNSTPPAQQAIYQQAVALIRESMGQYPSDRLIWMVQEGVVPKTMVSAILDRLEECPEVAKIDKEGFLEALAVARPDCLETLQSTAGDKWIDEVLTRMARELPWRMIGKFFGTR